MSIYLSIHPSIHAYFMVVGGAPSCIKLVDTIWVHQANTWFLLSLAKAVLKIRVLHEMFILHG